MARSSTRVTRKNGGGLNFYNIFEQKILIKSIYNHRFYILLIVYLFLTYKLLTLIDKVI
ncbi:hypothetical protein GFV14_00494 [Candidatus Hartigia pinicola]|nr:hypothetical protein GFV14_00494 [Candidatus Hartigia pinicola]